VVLDEHIFEDDDLRKFAMVIALVMLGRRTRSADVRLAVYDLPHG
jgi:hypothetical protein